MDLPKAKPKMTQEEDQVWFDQMCSQLADQASEKRLAYRDNLSKTAKFLELLYPDGIPVSAYQEVAVVIRVFDKEMRRANFHNHPEDWKDQENPWLDIAGYGIAMLYDIARGLIK